jgi:PAS domain S-box-containing protein
MLKEQPMNTGDTNPFIQSSPGMNMGSPRFLALVFAFLSVCIISVGWFFYSQREKSIKEDKQAELSAIADLKAEQIVRWREERFTDARVIISDPPVTSLYLEKYLRSAKEQTSQKTLSAWLTRLIELEHYRSAFLLDKEGKQLFSVPGGRTLCKNHEIQTLLDSAITHGCIAMSDLHRDETDKNEIHSILIVPIVHAAEKNGGALGALALDIDPNQFLYPLIQSWPTPSRTAEVLLVRKEGNDVVFLNELRNKKNTSFNLRLPLNSAELPAARAVSGDTGAMEGVDYRNVPVLAVARHIPGTPWFMVAKMDKSEAFAAGRRLFFQAIFAVVLLILLAGVLTALLQRHGASRAYKRLYLAEREKSDLAESLAAEKERLSTLTSAAFEGVGLSEKGILIDANDQLGHMLGYTRDELLNTPVENLVAPSDRSRVSQAMRQGLSDTYQHLALRKDGSEFVVEVRARMMRIGERNIRVSAIRDISEQKKAEEQIRESEELLRAQFTSAPDIILTIDKNFRILTLNKTMTGKFTPEELIGLDALSIIPPEYTALARETIERCFATGQIQEFEHRIGDSVWVRARIAPIMQDGRPYRAMIISTDITEKKRAEDALRKSEERFRLLFNSGRDAVAVHLMGKDGLPTNFIMVNDVACKTLGYTREELLALSPQDIDAPERSGQMPAIIEKLLKDKQVLFETEHISKDGRRIPVEISTVLFQLDDNQATMTVARDITERKKAAEALVAEKERLSVTLRSIGDAVIATDVSGRIVLMNKVAEALTGWPVAKAEGKQLSEVFVVVNEFTREPCENPFEKVLKSGSIVNLENHTVLIARDGRELVIADSGAPIKDRESNTIGVVLVFRDNSEKQRAQEAMQKTEKLESLGVLAGGIAHDFNNLLSGLFGYLDLARGSVKKNEQASQYIEKAFSVFGRAKDLTGQLLTFAKGGAPSRKTQSLSPLIRDAVHFALSGSAIQSRFDIPQDLWPCDVDENQIGQVLDNIIINARDAMPMGGVVTVSAENMPADAPLPPTLARADHVRITVRDQGTGIAPEHLPHIFDPFFTTKHKGSGLGLATAYSIVKRHDGTIEVESELGSGAAFHVYLPASAKKLAAETIGPRVARHTGCGRVLVMDDEDFIRDVAAAMLEDMGYTVETAPHGQEAVAIFTKAKDAGRPFALAILDLTIPGGMGGKETKEKLRHITPGVKILASSGYSEDPVMARPLDFGFDGSVRKPYDRAELSQAVAMVMKVKT